MRGSFDRLRYATRDADEGHDFLRRMYTGFDVNLRGSADGFALDTDVLQVGSVSLSHIRHSVAIDVFARDAWNGRG